MIALFELDAITLIVAPLFGIVRVVWVAGREGERGGWHGTEGRSMV